MTEETTHLSDELLNEYLDSALDYRGSSVVEAHLAACQDCLGRLTRLNDVFAVLRDLPDVHLERDLAPEILAAITGETEAWRSLPAALKALFGAQLLAASILLATAWPFALSLLPPLGRLPLLEGWATFVQETLNSGWPARWQVLWAFVQSGLEQGLDLLRQVPWLSTGLHASLMEVFLLLGAASILWLVSNGLLIHPIFKE